MSSEGQDSTPVDGAGSGVMGAGGEVRNVVCFFQLVSSSPSQDGVETPLRYEVHFFNIMG